MSLHHQVVLRMRSTCRLEGVTPIHYVSVDAEGTIEGACALFFLITAVKREV